MEESTKRAKVLLAAAKKHKGDPVKRAFVLYMAKVSCDSYLITTQDFDAIMDASLTHKQRKMKSK